MPSDCHCQTLGLTNIRLVTHWLINRLPLFTHIGLKCVCINRLLYGSRGIEFSLKDIPIARYVAGYSVHIASTCCILLSGLNEDRWYVKVLTAVTFQPIWYGTLLLFVTMQNS